MKEHIFTLYRAWSKSRLLNQWVRGYLQKHDGGLLVGTQVTHRDYITEKPISACVTDN
jgi:archaellum biogenesis ATPase FlaH